MIIKRVALTVNLSVYKINNIVPPVFDKIAVRSSFIKGLAEINGVTTVSYRAANGGLVTVYVMESFEEIFEAIKETEI